MPSRPWHEAGSVRRTPASPDVDRVIRPLVFSAAVLRQFAASLLVVLALLPFSAPFTTCSIGELADGSSAPQLAVELVAAFAGVTPRLSDESVESARRERVSCDTDAGLEVAPGNEVALHRDAVATAFRGRSLASQMTPLRI
jgi:hypothetical protein